MNHSLKTRALSLLLAVLMVVGMVPMPSMAAETEETTTPTETTPVVSEDSVVLTLDDGEDETVYVTVTFDYQNGTDPVTQDVESGIAMSKPEEPSYEGYTFLGWYFGEEAWDFATPVTADMTLTAVWEEKETEPSELEVVKFIVTFDAAGGSTVEAQTIEAGQTAAQPADPIYDGYMFRCWTCDGEAWDFATPVTADMTLTAVWEEKETEPSEPEVVKFTVTFDAAGGSAVEAQTVEAGQTAVEPEDPTYEGYTFLGWLNGETVYDFTAEVTADIVLTASWEAIPEEQDITYSGGLQFGMTDCDYYNIIESNKYTLVPGATEYQYILNDDSGSRRQVVHVIEVDTKNPNVSLMPSFKNISTDVDYTDTNNWGSITVSDHAAHAEKDLGKNVIGGMNVSLSWDFTHPYGLLIYEGKVLYDSRFSCEICGTSGHPGGGDLVIYKDGTAELRDTKQPLTGEEWMAQTVCFNYLVKDGKNLNAAESHTAGDPRSVIGIKEDGTLVMMMVDGRMAPYSTGFTNHEMAEIMIALGCVDAINCDGGGSSTFMTEREGSGALTVKSRFSDGSERQTLTALLVLSNVAATGEFDHAAIETDVKLVTPGSAVTFTAAGVDGAGAPAELPEGVSWQMADASMGAVVDGVFTSNGTVGTATVQMVYEGNVVGEASVDVVIPDSISFDYPNMTVPYGKSINLDVSAMYGNSPVTLKASDLNFTLENNTIGTIEGTTFTAVDDAVENPSSAITVTLVHNEEVIAEGTINLGRGSEIVYDFEGGAEDVSNWSLSYKGSSTPDKYYFNDTFEVVTAENGKVRNGNYSLKITSDGDSITCMNWCQTRFDGLNIDVTDAVSISFWMYIPEGSHGIEWDIGSAIPVVLGHEFKYGTGWQYFTVPVSSIGTNITKVDRFTLYHSDTNNTPDGYVHSERPNYYADVVYYIDDITVNYSSAVDDNQAPVISSASVSYEGVDTAVAIKGQTLPTNTVAFTANASDNYSGLDVSTVAVYVDGNQVAASCSDSGMIATGDINLANGGHVVRFQISDNMGNQSTFVEYYFVLNGGSAQNTIHYVPADPTLENVAEDSLVWMNLEATAIENVDKVTTVIDLDQNSKWELAHMELADGFTATYSVNAETNDATIVITRTGKVTATGKIVLASLPIRVWAPVFHQNGALFTEDAMKYRLVSVMSHVEKGVLTETDGTTVSFGSLEQVTSTEWNSTRLTSTADKDGWHTHTAEAMDDVAATCTKAGYTGRAFCEGCNSVVVWGTTEPATGHNYAIDETSGLMQCSCGDLFTGTLDGIEYTDGVAMDGWVGDSYYANGVKLTGVQKVAAPDASGEFYYNFGEDGICAGKTKYSGLFKDEAVGVYRYAYLGEISTGWKAINNEWYYFLSSTQAAAVGECAYGSVTYTFEETGRVTSGVWVEKANGWRYYYGPTYHTTGWQTIDGATYYFYDSYRLTGTQVIKGAQGNASLGYEFTEDGKLIQQLTTTGLVTTESGIYYLADGIAQAGLICVDGNYYYFRSTTMAAVCGTKYKITNTNGLPVAAETYEFGSDGIMVMKDGLVKEDDGILYFYKDGFKYNAGLIQIDGDYYYIRSNCQAVINATYYCQNTNDLLPVANYTFNADGKMVNPPAKEEEPDVSKNGLVSENDGLYYYVDGVKTYAGLIEIDGSYYYIRSNCQAVTDRTYYCQKTNDLLPVANYTFDTDGKMVIKHGLVEENGGLFYYQNGMKTYAGLIEIDGSYYYIRSSCQAVTNATYYCQKTNNLLPVANYTFDADGKMVKAPVVEEEEPDISKNGLVSENGGIYYYVDGIKTYAGMIEIDGDIYYIRSNCQAVTNATYYCQKTNDLLPVANYTFDADGKMVK